MAELNGTQRDIGRLEAEVADLKIDMQELKKEVRAATTILTEMQGGKKYILALFGLAAAVGAMVDKLIGYLH